MEFTNLVTDRCFSFETGNLLLEHWKSAGQSLEGRNFDLLIPSCVIITILMIVWGCLADA